MNSHSTYCKMLSSKSRDMRFRRAPCGLCDLVLRLEGVWPAGFQAPYRGLSGLTMWPLLQWTNSKKLVTRSIWLKSDLYLHYCIEDLILFSETYTDQSNPDFYQVFLDYVTTKDLKTLHLIWNVLSDWSKSWCNMQIQSSYKVNSNMISNGKLSDTLWDRVL